jgi:hypothetical protein
MDAPNRPTVELAARCACGAAELRVAGRVKAMLLCACEDCQRATGSGHASIAMFAADDVVIKGEAREYTVTAASGATMSRRFCARCGTPLAGQSSRSPDLVSLPVGLFGDAAAWFKPRQMIFARSHRDWDTVDAGLPRYATYRGAPDVDRS